MTAETRNSKLEARQASETPSAPEPIKDFTDLVVWRAARELRKEVYKLAKRLPDFEKFALANQLRRSATSITANIAEGFGRFGFQENIQHCRQARGSLYELRDHLMTCLDEEYISPPEHSALSALCGRVGQLLNGYIRATVAMKQAA
ncbi:MAG: four helix bundle protein [Terriglobia bacterium]